MARVRRCVTVWVPVVLLLFPLLAATPASAARRIRLPTEADLIGVAIGAETILFGPKGIETLLPGAVDDEEVVTVEIGEGDIPAAVGVRQRLVVHGLGDFRFKVSGPAQTVEALPDSESEPGLRKGAVLWQGFSDGDKVLSSAMELFPDQEATRLPLEASLDYDVGGERPEGPASGELSLRLNVENRSATPVTVTSAEGDPEELAGALDAIAGRLAEGERPRPGEGSVPAALTALGAERALTRDIPASFRITGQLSFESGTIDDASVDGPPGTWLVGGAGGPPFVRFDTFVGAATTGSFDVSITGTARDLGRPVLKMTARPAPPPPDSARPPGGGTWTELVAAGEIEDTRPMWNRIMGLAWRVAKLRQYDSYMGNPDPTGPASTVYRFRVAAPEPEPRPLADATKPLRTTPLLVTTALLALLLLLFDGLLLWSLL